MTDLGVTGSTRAQRTSAGVPTARQRRRVAAASLIGTTIEWYDYFIFGSAAALVFGPLFFPTADPLTGTLASFATFAADAKALDQSQDH